MKPLQVSFILAAAIVALSTCHLVAQEAQAPAEKKLDEPETRPEFKIEVVDEAFKELIDPAAEMKVVAEGFQWSEGPVWNKAKKAFRFSDVPRNKIWQLNEEDGLKVFMSPSGYDGESAENEPGSNGLAYDAKGRLIACDHGNRRVYRLEEDGTTKTTLADKYEGKRFNSPNDLVIKSTGEIFFTDPPYGLKDESKREIGFFGVYCLKPDGTVELVTKELERPNGIALSPDEKTIYVAQSHKPAAVYMKYTINEDGTYSDGEVLYDCKEFVEKGDPGMPDGLKIDVKGNLWATGPGGVLVISPEGKLLGRIVTATPTANCNFVDDGTTLAMTAGKSIVYVQTKTKALGDWGATNDNTLLPVEVVKELSELLDSAKKMMEDKEYKKLIELLSPGLAKDASEFDELVKNFATSDDQEFAKQIESVTPFEFTKKLKAKGRLKKIVDRFVSSKADFMKSALDSAHFTTAEYDSENQIVTFSNELRPLLMKKVDGQWKIKN